MKINIPLLTGVAALVVGTKLGFSVAKQALSEEKAKEYQFGVKIGRAIGYSECLEDHQSKKTES